jgi:hypothetical protein
MLTDRSKAAGKGGVEPFQGVSRSITDGMVIRLNRGIAKPDKHAEATYCPE